MVVVVGVIYTTERGKLMTLTGGIGLPSKTGGEGGNKQCHTRQRDGKIWTNQRSEPAGWQSAKSMVYLLKNKKKAKKNQGKPTKKPTPLCPLCQAPAQPALRGFGETLQQK